MAGIRSLYLSINSLAKVPSKASVKIADFVADDIQSKVFDAGRDPYAKGWKKLAPATLRKGRRPPPLTDTSELRNTLLVVPMQSAGIKIVITADYGNYHMTGTKHMPARPFLPFDGRLPKRWTDAIRAIVKTECAIAIRG